MNEVSAYAPGNVSCVFKIVPHADPVHMHSLGLGFTVSDGVTCTVRRSHKPATSILFNGQPIDFPTVRTVIEDLTGDPLELEFKSSLPISSGFGLSGASTLSAAHASNKLCGLSLDREELALKAHVAEVKNLTGLGDVCGQNLGGCLVKLVEGNPLAAERLDVHEREIYFRYFSPIHTREIIGDPVRKERINRAADLALGEIASMHEEGRVTFEACVEISRMFSIESGLLQDSDVGAIIEAQRSLGFHASMIMLGNAVFSTRPFDGCSQTFLANRPAGVIS